jgi:putative transposase
VLICTDNSVPFASENALFGLLKLSVCWLRLGINIQRIKPGHPEQNGRHERTHRTIKKEATKPASLNFLQQQEHFDQFIGVYNNERPHQALGDAYPGDLYIPPSVRVYEPPSEPDYPFHDRTVRVTRCGRICFGRRKINLSSVFAGQTVGIRAVADQIWLVSFMHYDLGFFDKDEGRMEPAPNPFAPV